MEEIIIRFMHFVGIIFFSGVLVFKHLIVQTELTSAQMNKLFKVNIVFALSAVVVLIFGLLLWLYTGKPSDFYTQNGLFHVKFSLFLLIGILSVFTTKYFNANKNTQEACTKVPFKIRMMINVQLFLLLVIAYCAVSVAQGSGL